MSCYDLPTSISIGEKQFGITNNGDYRMVLDCFNALNDEELSKEERTMAALIIFYEDITGLDNLFELFETEEELTEAIDEMYLFFNCGQEHIGMETNYQLVDWNNDSQIIMAGVNNVAHKEVRSEPYLHWWTFMGYYTSIGDSILSTVVHIRYKIARGKKLEKEENEFRKDNPHYFIRDMRTREQIENDRYIQSIWNKN